MTLQIKYVPLKRLTPYARNARTHPRQQIQKLKASLAEYGWANPMLIADGRMVAGHGRLIAALEMAEEGIHIPRNPDLWSGPTVDLSHLTETQRRAYVLMDNRSALDSGWDEDLLAMELGDLSGDIDLSLTGFTDEDLAKLLGGQLGEPETGEDTVSAPPVHPVSVPGDIWCLGRHRILCGDSTNPQHIERLMQGEQADFCFTSPPYAQQRDYKNGGIADWDALMQGVFSILPVIPGAQVLVNLGLVHRDGEWSPYWDGWIEWMRSAGWRRFGWYVWDQGFGLPGDWNGRFAPSHEFVFHFNREAGAVNKTVPKNPENVKRRDPRQSIMRGKDGKGKATSNPEASLQPNKIPDSVIRVMRQQGSIGNGLDHPAVFPVDFVSEMLTAFTKPDDLVFEPFCGSGTQIISAQKNGRSCYACEIAPEYCDVTIKRWMSFTGQMATLDETGKTFAEMSEERPFKE